MGERGAEIRSSAKAFSDRWIALLERRPPSG
jgi:hypothetical protein